MANMWSNEEIKKKFDEYLPALGKVAHNWNHLQENLGKLFASVVSKTRAQADTMSRARLGGVLLAVWYSEPSDRAQRRMLRAAINADAPKKNDRAPPHAVEDISWLLDEADKLGQRRDEALHAPFGMGFGPTGISVVAAYAQGNPLAKRLLGKDILDELSLSAWRAAELSRYAAQIDLALKEKGPAWPDKRPSLSRETRRQRSESHRQQSQ
jgi:hypothetical protein